MHEYRNIVESKKWENTDSKKISKYDYLLLKAYNVTIEDPVNKTVEKVYLRICHNGKENKYRVGFSTKSVATFHKCW